MFDFNDTSSVASQVSSLAASTTTSRSTAISALRTPCRLADQISDIDLHAHYDNVSDMPKIFLNGGIYVLAQQVRHRKPRTTWISAHGTFLIKLTTDLRKNGEFFYCRLCDSKGKTSLYNLAGTTSSMRHLNKVHNLQEEEEDDRPKKRQKTVFKLQR